MKKQNKIPVLAIVCISSIILSGVAIYSTFLTASAQEVENPHKILMVSKGNDAYFLERMQIDQETFNVTRILDTEALPIDLENYEFLIIFDANLSLSNIAAIETYINNGGASALFMGPFLHNNPELLRELDIIGSSVNLEINNQTMLPLVQDEEHPIAGNIDWNSAPALKIGRVSLINGGDLIGTTQNIIDMYPSDVYLDRENFASPLLMKQTKGTGSISIFMSWLERNDTNVSQNANKPYYVWPYFNYLLYSITLDGIGEVDSIPEYGDWAYSPVPHTSDRIVILIVVLALAALTVFLLFYLKMKMKSNSEEKLVQVVQKKVEDPSEGKMKNGEIPQGKLESGRKETQKDKWEIIGNHRQLSGFLSYFFLGLIIIIPQIVISSFLLPMIMGFSYAQAMGWYGFANRTFNLLYLVFDLGTSVVMVKKIAQYRATDPEKSMHYVQIFVWWQILTGVVQLFLVAFLGSIVFPQTSLAHMSWVFITFSLVQYPGFFLVFQAAFRGLQRVDLYTILQICWDWVFLLIGQLLFCYLGWLWGNANPVFGAALGASIGLAIANYFRFWMSFILGMILWKRVGFSISKIFALDFTKEELKEMLTFGSKLTIGNIIAPIVTLIQISVVSIYVADYSSELGYFVLAGTVGEMVQIIWLYALALMGALSESNSYSKHKLTNLYLYNGFRWVNYFGFFVISAVLSTGKYFLIGTAGEELGASASKYLIFIVIVQFLSMYSWLSQSYLQGSGRPGFESILNIIVQALRLMMLILVITTHQLYFIILALVPGLFVKDIVVWIYIRKKTKFNLYGYKSVLAPLVAAVINYFALKVVGYLIFQIDFGLKLVNTGILFVIGMFVFICFFAIIDGFLGGFDSNTLKEYRMSVDMIKSKFIRGIANLAYKSAELGTKISPFRNKFKITIYEGAMMEAYQLTLEKKEFNKKN